MKKEKPNLTEYFFPVYGGESKTILASSREEAEKIFNEGEKTLETKTIKEYE